MRAIQVLELSGPDGVSVADVPEPAGDRHVVVRVSAVGISFPDLLRSQGLYQDRSVPPYVLGSEFAGIVESAPEGGGWAAGDRVFGTASGAGADMIEVAGGRLCALPERFTFEQGAALVLNYETAIVALEIRGRIREGEIVVVHGAGGGTGTAAIQVARAWGARTIGVVSDAAKADAARQAGADDILMSDGPWKDGVLELTGGRGAHIVFDPVGGDRMLDTMRSLRPGGRWLVIGFVGGPIPQVPLNRVLLRNIDVVGSYYGGLTGDPEVAAQVRSRLVELLGHPAVDPLVGRRYGFEDAAEALRDLAGRRAIGKVVLSAS
jgi:NADPH2:quinone reductase